MGFTEFERPKSEHFGLLNIDPKQEWKFRIVIVGAGTATEGKVWASLIEEQSNNCCKVTYVDNGLDEQLKPAWQHASVAHGILVVSDRSEGGGRLANREHSRITKEFQIPVFVRATTLEIVNGRASARLYRKIVEALKVFDSKSSPPETPAAEEPPKPVKKPRVELRTDPETGAVVKYVDGVLLPPPPKEEPMAATMTKSQTFRPVQTLLVGNIDDLSREAQEKLPKRVDVDIVFTWNSTNVKNATRIPAEIEFVIILTDTLPGQAIDRVWKLAESAGIPKVRTSTQWSQMKPHIEREWPKIKRSIAIAPGAATTGADNGDNVDLSDDVLEQFAQQFNNEHALTVVEPAAEHSHIPRVEAAALISIAHDTLDRLVAKGEIEPCHTEGPNGKHQIRYFDTRDLEALEARLPDLVKGYAAKKVPEVAAPVTPPALPGVADMDSARSEIKALTARITSLLDVAMLTKVIIEKGQPLRVTKVVVRTEEDSL